MSMTNAHAVKLDQLGSNLLPILILFSSLASLLNSVPTLEHRCRLRMNPRDVNNKCHPENALLPIYPIRSLHLSIWAYDILSPQGAREPPFFFHLKGFVGQSSFPLLAAWRMPQTAMPYNSDPHSSTQKPTLDMPDQVLTVLRDAAHFSPSPHFQRAAVLALGIVDLIPVS